MTASATFRSGAKITPIPWVPSSSLITTGAPPTRSIAGITSARLRTKAVAGIPMSWRDKIWIERSLSLELAMPWAVFGVYTSISSNWRTTAMPKNVIDAPTRGTMPSKSGTGLPRYWRSGSLRDRSMLNRNVSRILTSWWRSRAAALRRCVL